MYYKYFFLEETFFGLISNGNSSIAQLDETRIIYQMIQYAKFAITASTYLKKDNPMHWCITIGINKVAKLMMTGYSLVDSPTHLKIK